MGICGVRSGQHKNNFKKLVNFRWKKNNLSSILVSFPVIFTVMWVVIDKVNILKKSAKKLLV